MISKRDFHVVKLGGLYARYLLKLLEDHGVFNQLEPRIFATFATPHIGWRREAQFAWTDVSRRVMKFISQTTRELGLEDKEQLLYLMTEEDYLTPLNRFPQKICYTNVVNDHLVPYATGALRVHNPYFFKDHGKAHRVGSTTYPAITEWSIRTVQLRKTMIPHEINEQESELLQRELQSIQAAPQNAFKHDKHKQEVRTMLQRLDALGWDRYDVVIHSLKSHERIINKHDNKIARSVVQHFIDVVLPANDQLRQA